MKKLLSVLLIGIIAVFMAACGSSDVDTGASEPAEEKKAESAKETKAKEKPVADEKSVDAKALSKEAIGLKVNFGEVRIAKDKISVGINLENTNAEQVSFYPDQGSVVVGDMQMDANMFMTSGDIGGDIQPGVKQDAVIEFLAPDGKEIDVASVKEIKMIFGDVTSADFMKSEPVEVVLPVK